MARYRGLLLEMGHLGCGAFGLAQLYRSTRFGIFLFFSQESIVW